MKVKGYDIKPCADLSCANLSGADLSCADLSRANLSRADLSCAHYQISNLLHSIKWGKLPKKLEKELIYRDALICGKDKMLEWQKGGKCPFKKFIIRDYYFKETQGLCKRILSPKMNDMELFIALCKANKIKLEKDMTK